MGCERNCDSEHLTALLEDSLRQANLPLEQIRCISSIELKANEVGLIHMAAELQLPFICYTADQLAEVEPLLSQRSDYVYKTVGVYGVAESAALLSAKELAALAPSELPELVLAKQKTARATCSIARAFPPLA
jgi:cobalt-precorrin 5A hydrolase